LGIDVGSVSTNLILIDHGGDLYLSPLYLRTQGQPIAVIKQGLALMEERLSSADRICGAATTGSGRSLAGALIGADIVKNESPHTLWLHFMRFLKLGQLWRSVDRTLKSLF
jgi:activator of 2-hydroxyglutaryl-CoA dehydratase